MSEKKTMEKQIDEMSKAICHAPTCEIRKNGGTCYKYCKAYIYAFRAINAGYRKASEIAEEIFAEIEHTARAAIILLKFEKDEKLRNTKTECYTDLIGYIAELKKKYTEE
jgi:hypothetical protein